MACHHFLVCRSLICWLLSLLHHLLLHEMLQLITEWHASLQTQYLRTKQEEKNKILEIYVGLSIQMTMCESSTQIAAFIFMFIFNLFLICQMLWQKLQYFSIFLQICWRNQEYCYNLGQCPTKNTESSN